MGWGVWGVIILAIVLIVLRGCMFRLVLCALSVCILVWRVILPRIVELVCLGIISVRLGYVLIVGLAAYLAILLHDVCHVMLGIIWILMFVRDVVFWLPTVGNALLLLVLCASFSPSLTPLPVLSVVR